MNKLLVVIDLQNDFINENTKHLIPKIEKLIKSNKYDNIVFTKFLNYYESIWYKKLNYKGCLTEKGQNIPIDTRNYKIIEKEIYSSLNKELAKYIKDNEIGEIYLCGVDTECCVLNTALDLFENNYDVYILKDYCACTHGIEKNNNALEIIARCIGKNTLI